MTDEEAARIREAKAEVTQWLANVKVSRYQLHKADKRLSAYVREVASHPERHNVWEQLGVRRFLNMCEKYGLSIQHVSQFIEFYELLYFPGKRGDQRYELTPVQVFQFASIYGFWHEGRRVVREACLFVPRKFSKTTGTASIAVYDLLFGEANGEVYVGANSSDQAHKCFDVIRGCMRHLDPNGRRYVINEEKIKSVRKDRSAFAQCLTAGARTKDGLNASVVIMDEFSQARDNLLLTVLTTSMGVRDNPLTVIITTASDVFDGPFYEMLLGYKQVLLGEYEDDTVFAHLFEPDLDDREDDPATWRKVHPHLGITVNNDFYEKEYKKAKRQGAEAMLAFRTKLLNVYAESERRAWIAPSRIRKVMAKADPFKLKRVPQAMLSIDLSERDDFTAVTASWYDPQGQHLTFHTKYFFPETSLPGHPNERLYRAWASNGYLTLLPGEVIDYDMVADYVVRLTDVLNVQGIGFDGAKSQQFYNDLRSNPDLPGVDTVLTEIRQGYMHFVGPVGAFEHGLGVGSITIDENPITAYCFGNAVLDYDAHDNCKPVKRTPTQKIDGVITILMCVRQWLDIIQRPQLS